MRLLIQDWVKSHKRLLAYSLVLALLIVVVVTTMAPWLRAFEPRIVNVSTDGERFTSRGIEGQAVWLAIELSDWAALSEMNVTLASLFAGKDWLGQFRVCSPIALTDVARDWNISSDFFFPEAGQAAPNGLESALANGVFQSRGLLAGDALEISFRTGNPSPGFMGQTLEISVYPSSGMKERGLGARIDVLPRSDTETTDVLIAASIRRDGKYEFGAPLQFALHHYPETSAIACRPLGLSGTRDGPAQGLLVNNAVQRPEKVWFKRPEERASQFLRFLEPATLSGRIVANVESAEFRGTQGVLEVGDRRYSITGETRLRLEASHESPLNLTLDMPEGHLSIVGNSDRALLNGRDLLQRRIDRFVPTDAKAWVWLVITSVLSAMLGALLVRKKVGGA